MSSVLSVLFIIIFVANFIESSLVWRIADVRMSVWLISVFLQMLECLTFKSEHLNLWRFSFSSAKTFVTLWLREGFHFLPRQHYQSDKSKKENAFLRATKKEEHQWGKAIYSLLLLACLYLKLSVLCKLKRARSSICRLILKLKMKKLLCQDWELTELCLVSGEWWLSKIFHHHRHWPKQKLCTCSLSPPRLSSFTLHAAVRDRETLKIMSGSIFCFISRVKAESAGRWASLCVSADFSEEGVGLSFSFSL